MLPLLPRPRPQRCAALALPLALHPRCTPSARPRPCLASASAPQIDTKLAGRWWAKGTTGCRDGPLAAMGPCCGASMFGLLRGLVAREGVSPNQRLRAISACCRQGAPPPHRPASGASARYREAIFHQNSLAGCWLAVAPQNGGSYTTYTYPAQSKRGEGR